MACLFDPFWLFVSGAAMGAILAGVPIYLLLDGNASRAQRQAEELSRRLAISKDVIERAYNQGFRG